MSAARSLAEVFHPLPEGCPGPILEAPARNGDAWCVAMGEAVAFTSSESTARDLFALLQPFEAPPATLQPSDREGFSSFVLSLRGERPCNSGLQAIAGNVIGESVARKVWRAIAGR
jgi:hypothetical protein